MNLSTLFILLLDWMKDGCQYWLVISIEQWLKYGQALVNILEHGQKLIKLLLIKIASSSWKQILVHEIQFAGYIYLENWEVVKESRSGITSINEKIHTPCCKFTITAIHSLNDLGNMEQIACVHQSTIRCLNFCTWPECEIRRKLLHSRFYGESSSNRK